MKPNRRRHRAIEKAEDYLSMKDYQEEQVQEEESKPTKGTTIIYEYHGTRAWRVN